MCKIEVQLKSQNMFKQNQVTVLICALLMIPFIEAVSVSDKLQQITFTLPDTEQPLSKTQNIFKQWLKSLQMKGRTANAESLGNLEQSTEEQAETVAMEDLSTSTAQSTTTTTTTTQRPLLLNPARNCSDCICGLANTQKRIVGGQETEVHQYPWMAMLLYGGRFYCAATLINDQFLITASHCVFGFRKQRISVRLLEHDRTMSNFHKIDRYVAEIHTHPRYSLRTLDNDIAIIKLSEPVEFHEQFRPVCMPTPGHTYEGEKAIVTGWGALKVGGPGADTLQEVQVPILSQNDCRRSNYGASTITDNMLCAGYDEGEKDACQGDSGGPLHVIVNGTQEHQLVGVVSWGEGCAKPGYPGVYTRVNRYGTWLKRLTQHACHCHSEMKKLKKF